VITKLLNTTCLVNKCRDGTFEIFSDLVFHGGDGQTLEMRRFCYAHIVSLLSDAGFTSPRTVADLPEWGIHYDNNCSHTILANKR
jgi:hypothetical protein